VDSGRGTKKGEKKSTLEKLPLSWTFLLKRPRQKMVEWQSIQKKHKMRKKVKLGGEFTYKSSEEKKSIGERSEGTEGARGEDLTFQL